MAEFNLHVPPAQDSHKNIVNILNDDCLQAVFLKLDNVWDVYRVAKVCSRFQDNVKMGFPFRKLELTVWSDIYDLNGVNGKFVRERNDISLQSFLSIFGCRIKSIKCMLALTCPDTDKFNTYVNLIGEYCGSTLTELTIKAIGLTYYFEPVLTMRWKFPTLKRLKVYSVHFDHIESMFPELESLSVCKKENPRYRQYDNDRVMSLIEPAEHVEPKPDWVAYKFPKLQHAEFRFVQISDEKFNEFVHLNSHLKGLYMNGCKELTVKAYQDIGIRLSNIVDLHLGNLSKDAEIIVNNLKAMPQIRKLHLFSNDINIDSVISLFSHFVENKQQIEELHVEFVNIELAKLIQKLTTIKRLNVHFTPDNIVLDIAKHLPALVYLDCSKYKYNNYNFSLRTLIKILECCKNLTELVIITSDMNLNSFKTLLKMATGRVKITFYFQDSNKLIQEEMKIQNQWVRFV